MLLKVLNKVCERSTIFLVNKGSPSISRRESSPGRSSRGAGKGRRAYNYAFGIGISAFNFPVAPRRLSCQISANQREVETNANINKLTRLFEKGS